MYLRFLIAALFLLAVPALNAQESPAPTKPPAKVNTRPTDKPENPSEPFDKASVEEMTKCVLLDTAKGVIELEMFPFTAPNTVRNFLNLTAIGAFDNTTFSRVVPKFVIQGGDLYTNENITYEMSVRAHKKLADEPNIVKHERGIISMARDDEPDSASTSFFILVDDADYLDDKFAAFGRVVKGMNLVDIINKMPVVDEAPKEPVLVSKATIKTCDVVSDKVAVVKSEALPKINDLPRFGLRGKVRYLKHVAYDRKGRKIKLGETGWAYKYSQLEREFGNAGDLKETRFFDENDTFLRVETYTSTIGAGKPVSRNEVIKDSTRALLRDIQMTDQSDNKTKFRATDASEKVVAIGEISKGENGRVLSIVWERFAESGIPVGNYTIRISYDAYGFEETKIETDENSRRPVYNRFEYTDFDDEGNWTERNVFDSEKAKKPVRVEKRTVKYYKESKQ